MKVQEYWVFFFLIFIAENRVKKTKKMSNLIKRFKDLKQTTGGFRMKFPKLCNIKAVYRRKIDNDYHRNSSKDGYGRNPHGGRPFVH